jgi:hypothetical protein
MRDMPRPRPPHLHREVSRHGRVVWYVRVGKGPRVRLKAVFGAPDFELAYQAAVAGKARPAKAEPSAGTLAWLIARHREVEAFTTLAPATRRGRESIFQQVIASAGEQLLARLTSDTITAGRDRRAKTPHQARHFLEAMRALFKWARGAKLVKVDPTVGVENPPRKSGGGYPAWTNRGTRRRL